MMITIILVGKYLDIYLPVKIMRFPSNKENSVNLSLVYKNNQTNQYVGEYRKVE